MLTIKKGNLFEHATRDCIIAHGCNAQGVMGSGVAKEIKQRFPEAYQVYQLQNKKGAMKLGTVTIATCANNIVVANCITQEFYGRDPRRVYVDYDAVTECMLQLDVLPTLLKFDYPLHIPFIGGGLANGNRDILLEIFEKELANVEATLWLL